MTRSRKIKTSVAALAGVLVLLGTTAASCDKVSEPWNDAPRSRTVNEQPADVISMPDGFSNAATKCDHGNRIYVLFHSDSPYGAIAVVPQDPTCRS